MKICDTEFDDPREFPPNKRELREYKEGKRTTVKELWVNGYDYGTDSVCIRRHQITMTNRGTCTFDGKQVKGEVEKKAISDLFAVVRVV